jgi:peptide/nickel transport system ATP-binding protein
MSDALLRTEEVTRTFGGGRTLFGRRKPQVHAVRRVTLAAQRGETLGIVGESGCGKTTLARMLVGLDRPTGGRIFMDGRDVAEILNGGSTALARQVQYVFQDPLSSLNPRQTIRRILDAPLKHLVGMAPKDRETRLAELLHAVNLQRDFLDRYPHEFSGGQAQRIGIARALAAEPEIIVLDEPVSALDVSVQAQVLNLLDDLKARFTLTYLFISHDLAVVEAISDRVAVMYFGEVVEEGRADDIFRKPLHPYTRLLIDSAPVPGRQLRPDEDTSTELPDPLAPPMGCPFAPRCPRASAICGKTMPALEAGADAHAVACHHPL